MRGHKKNVCFREEIKKNIFELSSVLWISSSNLELCWRNEYIFVFGNELIQAEMELQSSRKEGVLRIIQR